VWLQGVFNFYVRNTLGKAPGTEIRFRFRFRFPFPDSVSGFRIRIPFPVPHPLSVLTKSIGGIMYKILLFFTINFFIIFGAFTKPKNA